MNRYLPLVAGILAVGACNSETKAPDQTNAGVDVAMPAPETVPGDVPGQTVQSPQQFVDAVASSDMFEIEAAKLAQKNGKSKATKDFAAMMIKDHTASTAKLKDAALKVQPAVKLPTTLPSDLQTKLGALKSAGTNFDTLYAGQQVEAHDKALALLNGYSESGGDPGLKMFAGDTAKVVETHASHARELPGK